MTINSKQIRDLNRMNVAAQRSELGTIIASLSSGSEIQTAIDIHEAATDPHTQYSTVLGQSKRDAFVYDDFDEPDRLLVGAVTPTGQAWTVSGVGVATAAITDGRLVATGNVYACLDFGGSITTIEGVFSCVPGSGANDATTYPICTLIADKRRVDTGGLSDMLHLLIYPTQWVLQKRRGGGEFAQIGIGIYSILSDGTKYRVAMHINGTAVTVTAPDGTETIITDADIPGIAPRYGTWQILAYADGMQGRWDAVGLGRSIASKLIASGGGAPMAEVRQMKGGGISKKKTAVSTLTGGAGWYRISTASILGSFAIGGRVKICATNAGLTDQGIELTCKYIHSLGVAPVVTQVQNISFGGQIGYVRLSADANGNIGLDIYYLNLYALPLALRVDYEGYFEPVAYPTVGAADYVTQSTTVVLS